MIYKSNNDEELMLLIAKNDNLAFGELYDRYARKLVNFFYRMLNKDSAKSQDFLHDLFLKIIEHPEKFNPEKKFSTWIYSIAYNMCKNEYKRNNYKAQYHEYLNQNSKQYYEFIKENSDMNNFSESLHSELSQLDESQRIVFLLRYNDELSINEIAEITGSPTGTVKSRLFYVLKKLANKLAVFNPYSE